MQSSMQETAGMQLRNKYTKDPPVMQNNADVEYLAKLKLMGVQLNSLLYPAYFQLKNGLRYPGMATKGDIGGGNVLVKVPEKLILCSMKALSQPALREVFEEEFYKVSGFWQDRILHTYCLYIYSIHDNGNIFYSMVQHMPKSIDILAFWQDEQLDLFMDKTVKSAGLIERKQLKGEWEKFKIIQQKHKVLQTPEFNQANYQWLLIHVTSRCFGKGMDYISFVPYCQLFNHHSSSVYYQITRQQPDVPNDKQDKQPDCLSSDGSNDSCDYFEQGEFAYDQLQPVVFKWGEKEQWDLDKKQKNNVEEKVHELLEDIQVEINWLDFSILFVGHFIERVYLIQSQYVQGRKNYLNTVKNLDMMKEVQQKYLVLIKQFYKQKKGKSYEYKIKTRDNISQIKEQKFIRPKIEQYHPGYTNFYLKTDKKDKFDANTQVYFCYGRNSNRTLLLHYGFAIEGNKYQHVWLSYQLNGNLKYMPELVGRIEKLGLSIRRRYKVNYTRLNLDLIIFFRLNSWELFGLESLDEIFFVVCMKKEVLILEQIVKSLEMYLEIYRECQDSDLEDKSIGYHEYFVNVYHLEKKRILTRQIELFGKLIKILNQLDAGKKMEEAIGGLSFAERYMFKNYLDSVVI